MGALIAFTEGERLGLLALVGVCVTAAASVTAAVIAHRTKRENSDQHQGVHAQLSRVASSVETQSEKIDGLRDDIAAVRDSAHLIAKRVDHAHERIDHQSWLRPDK
jgi:outer membrane murein-binding lipoprotein Lpp